VRVRIECPLNFLSQHEIDQILKKQCATISDNDPEVVLVNPGTSKYLGWSHFRNYKNLKVVSTPSTGTNHIDKVDLEKRGIKTTCLLEDRASLEDIHASAEFTWIHIMNLVRKFTSAVSNVDEWRSESNELHLRSNELYGKSIGIVGLGRIGSKIANYAKAFGLKVYFYDPYVENNNFTKLECLDSISNCDIVSINCSLSNETFEMITAGVWEDIKIGSFVVNTSRGEVVNENHIVNLIKNRKIFYGTDVLSGEQEISKLMRSPILALSKTSDRVVITPHVAGATKESQTKAFVSSLRLASNLGKFTK